MEKIRSFSEEVRLKVEEEFNIQFENDLILKEKLYLEANTLINELEELFD